MCCTKAQLPDGPCRCLRSSRETASLRELALQMVSASRNSSAKAVHQEGDAVEDHMNNDRRTKTIEKYRYNAE